MTNYLFHMTSSSWIATIAT